MSITKFQSLLILLFLVSGLLPAKATGLKKLCRLPEKVAETSGIEITGPNQIWSLNDSGGEPELYLCDTLGNLLRTVRVENAKNHDWEDLTRDKTGNFYIGDTGNNNNDRKNLCIYKITNPQNATNDTVEAQKIEFTWEDQSEFPPSPENMNFDCEAIIWFQHQIYLFSKNRSFPVRTTVYRIPDQPGTYVARKLGSFETGAGSTDEGELFSYWITSAAISPDGNKLALLSQDRVWLFFNFNGDNFFDGQHRLYELESATQKEAVCFCGNKQLYLSDEHWPLFDAGRNLYRLYLGPLPGKTKGN